MKLFIFLFIPFILFSQSITSVSSDSIAQDSSFVITGTSFGDAPVVVHFDNYESGSDGVTITTSHSSTIGGAYDAIGGFLYNR